MHAIIDFIGTVNDIIWADAVLYGVLATGILFTIWSGFCQYRALTHGVQVTRGVYDDPEDPGAINHFQALSAALSATVGLGNIGGVALAIALGGPGAVFWMWVVGLVGMALKTTEVTLAMMYRNTDDPDNPHGGAMWVAQHGFRKWGAGGLGTLIGGIFCITLLISAVTGGNMFQSWNVADVTYEYFLIPQIVTGIILAVLVGLVIIGGIKRIGAVAGRLVPLMCVMYLLSGLYVLIIKINVVPEMLKLIFVSAFSPLEAQGAFIGGTFGYAFLWGMKRALFSNEAGQGSAPIAHSAAKTDEPVREAVVSGLEPFIDTIVVCTLTALVILCGGMWNRPAEAILGELPAARVVQTVTLDDGTTYEGYTANERDGSIEFVRLSPSNDATITIDRARVTGIAEQRNPDGTATWTFERGRLDDGEWKHNQAVYTIVSGDPNEKTKNTLWQFAGTVLRDGNAVTVHWHKLDSSRPPTFELTDAKVPRGGLFVNYKGASLTAKAFDSVTEGLGKWLVTLAAWLFAISTMISWSYYGEQGMVYLLGQKSVLPYKLIYCLLIVVAAIPQLVKSEAELDALTSLGTGVMLLANIPIMLIFGYQAMGAYHRYMRKLRAGEFHPHAAPSVDDVMSGKDVE